MAPAAPGAGSLWSYPVLRLFAGLMLTTIGSSAMYLVSVALPHLQQEFNVSRSDASLPYSAVMLGFGIGGILMGWFADRFGTIVPVLIGAVGLSSGYMLAAQADSLASFTLIHGLLLGLLGSSATFSPLIADTSLWFTRRRGIAVAICASGNYLAGTVWPPIVQRWIEADGWRSAYDQMGWVVLVISFPLAMLLWKRAPSPASSPVHVNALSPQDHTTAGAQSGKLQSGDTSRPLGFKAAHLQFLLCVAGIGCCIAMSMPQVHIVAYCSDLGFGAARGAEMLSLMLAFGILSRLISGAVCDRIGGLMTLLIGSALQASALLLFLFFDSLLSLYVISATFGLFQGGLVPAYAIIVREYFSPREAGMRVGVVLTSTIVGMAIGGWMSGFVFDLTGSYGAAFVNGIAWNMINFSIIYWLLRRSRQHKLVLA